jgi:hypothetical protein
MKSDQPAESPADSALRPGQFSLRTFFVLTTIVAVCAALTAQFGPWALALFGPAAVFCAFFVSLPQRDMALVSPAAAGGVFVSVCALPFFGNAWFMAVWLGSVFATVAGGVVALCHGYVRGLLVIFAGVASAFAVFILLSQIQC